MWRGATKIFPALCAGHMPPLFVPAPLPTIERRLNNVGYYSAI